MHANRWCELLIPLSGIVVLEGLIGEDARGTNLDKVAAEFVLQYAVLAAAEKYCIARGEGVQAAAAGIVAVIAHAAVALDTPIRLVIHQRAEVLVAERAFIELVAPVVMAGHDSHVLQVALAAFVAHRA